MHCKPLISINFENMEIKRRFAAMKKRKNLVERRSVSAKWRFVEWFEEESRNKVMFARNEVREE